MINKSSNDSGVAQALYFFVVGMIIFLFYIAIIIYPIVNSTTTGYNAYNAVSMYPVDTDQQNTMWFLHLAIDASGPIGFLIMIVSYLLISYRNKYGVN